MAPRLAQRAAQQFPVLVDEPAGERFRASPRRGADRRRKSASAPRPRRSRRGPDPNPRTPFCRPPAPGCAAASLSLSRRFERSSSAVRSATRRSSSALSCSSCRVLRNSFGEDLDLRPQHFRHDRDRNIIDRAHLVAAQTVDIGEMDGGNEDDRGVPEARMLADHRGQLETVELRHADVDQDDGDFGLEQMLQRLAAGRRLDQVLVECRAGSPRSSAASPAGRRPAGC